MLLTMKTKPLLPPPGVFVHEDLYSKRYWKRAQYLADQFCIRWRNEDFQMLHPRSKSNERHPDLKVGDIVLIKVDAHRNEWPMGRVVEAIKSKDDEVRQARISIWKGRENKIYLGLIHKLVLLMRWKMHSIEGDTSPNNT